MYGIGVWLVMGSMGVAIVLGGTVALLLHLREPLHDSSGGWGRGHPGDHAARPIALVILPILPDRTFGPYGVLNPYQIWWMVVLIVGLSLLGYVAFKLFGQGGRRLGGCSAG